MISQANLDLMRNLMEGGIGDLDGFLARLSPDVEWRFADSFVYGQTNPLIGREALRHGSLKRLRTEWDGFDAELDELLDAGDEIVALDHYVGTHKATGRWLRAQFAHVYTVKDGLIVRRRQYVDTLQFAEVTGERA